MNTTNKEDNLAKIMGNTLYTHREQSASGSCSEGSDHVEAADDEEAARRVVWIQYHLRLGNYDEATELGWDGDQ